jgi:hypothetical protein
MLERFKSDRSLRAALAAEGRALFRASLGFLGIDGETGQGAWFHLRAFYLEGGEQGCRIVPMASIEELVPLQQPQSGYFVAVLRRPGQTVVNKPDIPDGVPNLIVEMAHEGEITVVTSTGYCRPLTPVDGTGPLQGLNLRVGAQPHRVTMPTEVSVEFSGDRCHLVLSCDDSRLGNVDHEFVLARTPQGRRRDGNAAVRVDIEAVPGNHDRLIVAVDSRAFELRSLTGIPREPLPPLVLHVVFDRTAIDDDRWSEAALATIRSLNETTPPPTGHWNELLRRRTAEAMKDAVAGMDRRIELELWPFADVPSDAMSRSHLTLSETSPAWSHIPCGGEVNRLTAALNDGNRCSWRYGLDYVDAVDEALEAVESAVADQGAVQRERKDEQHAVLIVGDSPPPPQLVADPLWDAIVEERQTNCRRSSRFMDTLARLRQSQTPVLWAFIRLKGRDTGDDESILRLHRIQERVASALAGIEGLIVSACYSEDLTSTICALVKAELGDPKFRPPDRTNVRRGNFNELD